MHRHRAPRIGAGLLAVVLAAGCNSGRGTDPVAVDDDAVETPSVEPTPSDQPGEPGSTPSPASTAPPGASTAAIYYLVDTSRGIRLQREFRQVRRSDSPVRAAVEAMLHEPPLDRDYTSIWPRTTQVRGISRDGAVARVDLSSDARKAQAGAEGEAMSLQQLVHTVTAADTSVQQVQLLVEGKPVEDLWGHVDASRPQSRGSHIETLAPISISTPNEDSTVGPTFTLSGTATVFEANVQWRVTRGCPADVSCVGEKPVYRSGFVTASAGAPARGTWSVRITVPDEVFETSGYVEITAFEESMEDGSEVFADTKVVRVTR